MYMIKFMFLMHDIFIFSTCCDEMHGPSLYDVVLSYMHNVGLNDYIMKVLLGMSEVDYACLLDVTSVC